jgi:DNA-binding NarL/FixJ family response regulator
MEQATEQTRIRLMVVDDQALLRASLSRFLATQADLEVVGECGTSAEALGILKSSTVDVVLLDFDSGREQGNDFMSDAREAGFPGRFLILAASLDLRRSAIALTRGASGMFLKCETPDRLVQAIQVVGKGGMWVDRTIIQFLADQLVGRGARPSDQRSSGPLEDRERDVLWGILQGLSNRKIGDTMGLRESGVKNIVQRLFGKAGVNTRGQLVRVALEGWLGLGQEFIKHQANEALRIAPAEASQTLGAPAANLPVAH